MERGLGAVAGGIAGLAALLEEHSEAVEADLQRYYGLQLGGLFTGALTWRRLGVLLRHLPAESALQTALRDSQPPEAAAARVARAAARRGHGPWSSTDMLLAAVVDALSVLAWQQAQIHGGKKSPAPAPIPRPGVETKPARAVNAAGVAYLNRLREQRAAAQPGSG